MQSYNQKQPGGEKKVKDNWNGRPVARTGNSDVRLAEPGNQGDNAQGIQDQYENRDPDIQQQETNDKDDEEDHERDRDEQDSDLSRRNINKKMAEMQENYNEKRIKEQRQQQQEMRILPQEQEGETRQRSLYRQVAPIPAVQRQDTAEEHKEQSDGRLWCQEVSCSLCV